MQAHIRPLACRCPERDLLGAGVTEELKWRRKGKHRSRSESIYSTDVHLQRNCRAHFRVSASRWHTAQVLGRAEQAGLATASLARVVSWSEGRGYGPASGLLLLQHCCVPGQIRARQATLAVIYAAEWRGAGSLKGGTPGAHRQYA
jgi:hypothetical protein